MKQEDIDKYAEEYATFMIEQLNLQKKLMKFLERVVDIGMNREDLMTMAKKAAEILRKQGVSETTIEYMLKGFVWGADNGVSEFKEILDKQNIDDFEHSKKE